MATITAVCRSSVGPIRDLPETLALARVLFDEVLQVGAAYGYDLASSMGLNVETAPPGMKASMARDFERGGRTELDALTGALVRMADAKGVDVPASRTAYAILKLREQLESGTQNRVGNAAVGR
jgi:2-dehydropantoate 2-reductase